jgi:accessory gene regulator protein AgrB
MFLTIVFVVLGIAMIALGIFSAYFGKGKNRNYGLLLAVVGAIILIVWVYLAADSEIEPISDVHVFDLLRDTLIHLVGVLIGVLIAAGIFLVTVLKS